ncbi:MAG: alanine racemase [Treponema sp.]|nr:alanine racemase [Treponema sp.]
MLTSAVIHIDRFLRNFKAVKDHVGQTRICVPVKADAYGHGAVQIAKASLQAGAYCLGVSTVYEGQELRKAGIKSPILLFSQCHPDEIPMVIKEELTPFISDEEFAAALNEQAQKKVPVHIKIDTGMGRIGCRTEDALPLARFISSCAGLELAGTATHFAAADSAQELDIAYTMEQLACFKAAVEQIRSSGINPGIVHAANSGAIIQHPDSRLDMVRPGILLYGYKTVNGEFPEVEPVLELKTTVSLIKKIKKGETVSYGRTWTAREDTFIAILPIGYADGLPRIAGNKWQVKIGTNAYPLAGRVTMDLCCIDLGPQPKVRRWEEAIVIDNSQNNAAKLASAAGTIPYEITCNISKRVPRIYIGDVASSA